MRASGNRVRRFAPVVLLACRRTLCITIMIGGDADPPKGKRPPLTEQRAAGKAARMPSGVESKEEEKPVVTLTSRQDKKRAREKEMTEHCSRATSDFRFQISDFRFQISDPNTRPARPGDRFLRKISDFRFEIPAGHKVRNIEGKQNSKRAEQSHFKTLSQISARPRFQISDPKTGQISDFRFQTSYFRFQNAGHAQAEISDIRKQISKEPGQIPQVSVFRFQIPQRSRLMWHLHCSFQNA